jgi:hypothetical protein
VAEIVMEFSWSEYVIGDNLSRFRWIPDTTSVDIHETPVARIEPAEFWPIFYSRDKGPLLFEPNLMGAFSPKIFGFGVDVVIVHSLRYHLLPIRSSGT